MQVLTPSARAGPSGGEPEVQPELLIAVGEPQLGQALVGEECESKHIQQAWQREDSRGATAGDHQESFSKGQCGRDPAKLNDWASM